MRQPLLALAALSLTLNTTGPTMAAERVYACDGGAFVTYLSGPREMRVSMPGTDGWAIAMPLAIEGDHVVVWSPHGENSVDKNYAPNTPYVVQTFHEGQWFPNGTASETSFDLGTGEVQCALVP
jgi:hypothetical protein